MVCVQFAYCAGLIDTFPAPVVVDSLRDVVVDSFSGNVANAALAFEAELCGFVNDGEESAIDWVHWISRIALNRRKIARGAFFKLNQGRVEDYDR